MGLYVLSRTVDGELEKPSVSGDKETLERMRQEEHAKVLKDAGHLARDYGELKEGELVAYYGSCRHVWRIDEVELGNQ